MERPAPDLDQLLFYFRGVSRAAMVIERKLGAGATVPRDLQEIAARYRRALEATKELREAD